MKKARITLLGASGFTGSLVGQRLTSRGIPFSTAGRLESKSHDAAISHMVVDVNSSEQVSAMVAKTDILINCVGPYNLYGRLPPEMCIEQGIVYLDITGEQEYVRGSMERQKAAIETGAAIIHSVSFESFLADFLAARLLDPTHQFDDISSFYLIDPRLSAGTALTIRLSSHYPTYKYSDSILKRVRPLADIREIDFPSSGEKNMAILMPLPEIIFFPRRYSVRNTGSYFLMNKDEVYWAQQESRKVTASIDEILERWSKRKHFPLTIEERQKQRFQILVNALDLAGRQTCLSLRGNDTYGLTAAIIAVCVERILDHRGDKSGVFSPFEFFEDQELLNDLVAQNNLDLDQDNVHFNLKPAIIDD